MLITQLILATTHLLLFHGLFSKFKTHLREEGGEKKGKTKYKKGGNLSASSNPQHAMNKYDICLK